MTVPASVSGRPSQQINQSVSLNPEDLRGNLVGESDDDQTLIV